MRRIVLSFLVLAACSRDAPDIVERWTWSAPAPAYVGMPTTSQGRVAVTYGHSYLAVLEHGRPRWRTRLVGLRDVAPTFFHGATLAATDDGIAAFGADGALRWHRNMGDRVSTPVLAGERVVVTTWDGRLQMLDGWTVTLPGPSLGPPAAEDGVIVASWDAGVTAVSDANGDVLWERDFGAATSAPAIFGRDAIVVGDRRAYALDLRTGRERWSVPMKGAGSPEAPPAVDGGRVAIVDRLGHLLVVDRDGDVRRTADADGAVVRGGPVWIGDAVAVPIDDGRVMVTSPRRTVFRDPPGRVSGVAASGDSLLVATREAATNSLTEFKIG